MAAFMELGKCQRLLPLLPEVVKAWADAYPDVDLCAEIRKADAWAVTNKITRSAKGWGKTMNTWLSKEQDRVRATPKNAGAAAPVRGKYGNL